MNKVFALFLFTLLPWCFLGDEETSSYSYWDLHPLHIGGNMLRVGRASINSQDNGCLYFRKNNAYINLLIPVNRLSYFLPRIEWNNFTLNWNHNPKFHETHFYYGQFGLMFFTSGLENWRWILRTNYNIDLEHFAHPGLYGLFSFLAWGKYTLHRKWHYHVGTMGSVGMEGHTVYPVIGFDFSPNRSWMFEAIFPILYSIRYKFNEHWHVSLKGRPLQERFRVGRQQPQPRSVFNYSTIGTEFNAHYEQFLWLEIEAYVGYNFGGTFYIKDQNGHNPLYTEVGGAFYGGASIDYGF